MISGSSSNNNSSSFIFSSCLIVKVTLFEFFQFSMTSWLYNFSVGVQNGTTARALDKKHSFFELIIRHEVFPSKTEQESAGAKYNLCRAQNPRRNYPPSRGVTHF